MAADDERDPLLPSPTNGFKTRASSFIAAWEQAGGDEQRIQQTYESSSSHYAPHIPDRLYPNGYDNVSGVTIGFGYDIGQHPYSDLQSTWGNILTPDQLSSLEPYTSDHTVTVMRKGKLQTVPVRPTRAALAVLKANIHVRYDDAVQVFQDTTLPKYRADTYAKFPGLKDMDPWTKAAILDMTYQRGPAVGTNRQGVTVKGPVLDIKKALLRQDTKAIAAALRQMTVGHARRVSEAKMIEDHLIPGQQWLDYMDRHPPADATPTAGSATTP